MKTVFKRLSNKSNNVANYGKFMANSSESEVLFSESFPVRSGSCWSKLATVVPCPLIFATGRSWRKAHAQGYISGYLRIKKKLNLKGWSVQLNASFNTLSRRNQHTRHGAAAPVSNPRAVRTCPCTPCMSMYASCAEESPLLCSEESVSNVEPTVENGSKNYSTRSLAIQKCSDPWKNNWQAFRTVLCSRQKQILQHPDKGWRMVASTFVQVKSCECQPRKDVDWPWWQCSHRVNRADFRRKFLEQLRKNVANWVNCWCHLACVASEQTWARTAIQRQCSDHQNVNQYSRSLKVPVSNMSLVGVPEMWEHVSESAPCSDVFRQRLSRGCQLPRLPRRYLLSWKSQYLRRWSAWPLKGTFTTAPTALTASAPHFLKQLQRNPWNMWMEWKGKNQRRNMKAGRYWKM